MILSWLNSLRLTLQQWAMVTMAAIIGVLVVSLKVQGSKLHAAQIAALKASVKGREDLEDATINALKEKLNRELEAYKNA